MVVRQVKCSKCKGFGGVRAMLGTDRRKGLGSWKRAKWIPCKHCKFGQVEIAAS